MSDDTYREPAEKPVCANCKHRADAKMMDQNEPWRDWFCRATSVVIFPEQYNPITGETTPEKRGMERCTKVNSDGTCTKFESADAFQRECAQIQLAGARNRRQPPSPNPTQPTKVKSWF